MRPANKIILFSWQRILWHQSQAFRGAFHPRPNIADIASINFDEIFADGRCLNLRRRSLFHCQLNLLHSNCIFDHDMTRAKCPESFIRAAAEAVASPLNSHDGVAQQYCFFFVGMRTDSWSSDADICHLNENWNASNTRGTPRIKFNRGIVKKHIAGSKCSKESFCLSHSNVCGLWRWNNKMGKSILFVCDQRLFLK